MRAWKTAVFGSGFMGRVHMEAIRRLGDVEVVAVATSKGGGGHKLAAQFSVDRVETDYRKILDDPSIEAVHICTPNAQHFPVAQEALAAGKHVVCEKPLATTVEEARVLVAGAAKAERRNCLNHNLRNYPAVQQMRQLREAGELGEILVVQGTYSQDWLLYDTDYNWRVETGEGGASRCMADIGSHFFDMAEHVTGGRVTSLCADLNTFHKTRKRPKGIVETFAGKLANPDEYDEVAISTEDYGGVIFRMGNGARGAMTASQVSAGRKNRLSIEIYGSKSSVAWDQEKPDELWMGNRNSNNQILIKDPSLLLPGARTYADLPGGHSEGYDDTFKQMFRRFYGSLDSEGAVDYPQFRDGLRQLTILQAELDSAKTRAWVDVPAPEGGNT